eukprot:scaffold18204_cov30-Tisochrysis_lutea.AAC.3
MQRRCSGSSWVAREGIAPSSVSAVNLVRNRGSDISATVESCAGGELGGDIGMHARLAGLRASILSPTLTPARPVLVCHDITLPVAPFSSGLASRPTRTTVLPSSWWKSASVAGAKPPPRGWVGPERPRRFLRKTPSSLESLSSTPAASSAAAASATARSSHSSLTSPATIARRGARHPELESSSSSKSTTISSSRRTSTLLAS